MLEKNKTFGEIYTDATEFKDAFDETPFEGSMSDDSLEILYVLLSGKYYNSTIASEDETQFSTRLFSIVWQYGPTWERNVEIQKTLRELQEGDLMTGSLQVNDYSLNPSTEVGSDGLLTTINQQTATKYKRSKMEAYATLTNLLERDVTESFLDRFKPLFRIII